jgi:hypothetical protein
VDADVDRVVVVHDAQLGALRGRGVLVRLELNEVILGRGLRPRRVVELAVDGRRLADAHGAHRAVRVRIGRGRARTCMHGAHDEHTQEQSHYKNVVNLPRVLQ